MDHRGDTGFTTALGRESLSKGSPEVICLGVIEELDAHLQLALEVLQDYSSNSRCSSIIREVESFIIPQVRQLPACMDKDESQLPSWTEHIESLLFYYKEEPQPDPIFQGPAVYLNLARVTVRRLERCFCCKEQLRISNNDGIVRYLNRLSTLLWCWSCESNHWSRQG